MTPHDDVPHTDDATEDAPASSGPDSFDDAGMFEDEPTLLTGDIPDGSEEAAPNPFKLASEPPTPIGQEQSAADKPAEQSQSAPAAAEGTAAAADDGSADES